MNLEQLKNAWVEAGTTVSDLNAKLNQALIDDATTESDVVDIKNKLTNARAKRDMLKEQVVTTEAEQVISAKKEPLDPNEKNLSMKFVKDFKAMITGDPEIRASLGSKLDENGNGVGLTIPADVVTTINTLRRSYNSLQELVTTESVTTSNGSRVYEKWSDITPLNEMDAEDGKIPDNEDPTLTLIKYLIKRYAGITTLTNTLLKDSAENILAYLNVWIARKSVITRNKKILDKLEDLPASSKSKVSDIDGIKDIVNTMLDPAIASTSGFITNQNGFNALDKVKQSDGTYALQKDITSPTGTTFLGKPIAVIANRWLPDTKKEHPLYIGDLKEAIILYDRESISLLATNIGGDAFETDTTKVRMIDRFDVAIKDNEAVVSATFETIANEEPVKPPETPGE